MALSITTKRHEALANELPSYADMHEYLQNKLDNLKRKSFSGNETVIVQNIMSVLEQSAKLITTQDIPKDEAEEQLNGLLR